MLTLLLAIPAALWRAVRHFIGDPIDPIDHELRQLIAEETRRAAQLDAEAIRRHDENEGNDP